MADRWTIQRLPESVVNQIAAGEIIQRPANVVKELLENAIDAGATQVNVTVKEGGLKMILVQDNGHGIAKSDLPLLCERFSTSKLRQLNDLQSIASFGFRGEALASISHVAHLTVTTKTAESPVAYRQTYKDGLAEGDPKPLAGNAGTSLLIEDLFYGQDSRRQAIRCARDEYNRILQIVSHFGVHLTAVGLSLRRAPGVQPDVHTRPGASQRDNIAALFGEAVAKDLVPVSVPCPQLGVGLASRLVVSAPHVSLGAGYTFVLFINNRLVQCGPLKRALQIIMAAHMPVVNRPLVYVSLHLPPSQLDVNMHPTKSEVHFLHQTEIVEHIQRCVDTQMRACNEARPLVSQQISVTNYRQTKLTNAESTKASAAKQQKTSAASPTEQPSYDPSRLVRTDAQQSKLDSFLNDSTTSLTKSDDAASSSKSADRFTQHWKQAVDQRTSGGSAPPSNSAVGDRPPVAVDDDQLIDPDEDIRRITSPQGSRQLELASLAELREQICRSAVVHERDQVRGLVYVGCVDSDWALVQQRTTLYALPLPAASKQLFYQTVVFQFGNLRAVRLQPAVSVQRLFGHPALPNELAIRDEEQVQRAIELLESRSLMLWDYFSIKLTPTESDLQLEAVPDLLHDYPLLVSRLPTLLVNIVDALAIDDEMLCLREISVHLAALNAFGVDYSRQHAEWPSLVSQLLMPALKRSLLPARGFDDETSGHGVDVPLLKHVVDLHQLYRVFERC